VLLRLRIVRTFTALTTCAVGLVPRNRAAATPVAQIPDFSLYEDGSVIFRRQNTARQRRRPPRVLRAQLGAGGARALRDEILALGLLQIDDRPKRCDSATAPRSCMTDAAVTAIEALLPSGERHVVHNYAGIAVAQEQLDAILHRLMTFSHPSELDYLPSRAGLFIERCSAADGDVQLRSYPKEFLPWPLAASLLGAQRADAAQWGAVLGGDAYQVFYSGDWVPGASRTFVHHEAAYVAFMVPVLPDGDPDPILKYRFP
jgi:hypothetical protein